LAVYAAGLNRADLVQRAGRYPPPPGASPILGLEAAGRVLEVAPDVTAFQPGQAVMALLSGGGYAQEVIADADCCLPVPAGLGWVQAAALPEVMITAHLNLVQEGGLRAGERVVLHAGASGVGTFALQLCRLVGAPALAVVGQDDKADACRALGAAAVVNRRAQPWAEAVRAWAPDGVDLILDPVGATVSDGLALLRPRGRLIVLGLMGGRTAEVDLGRLLVARLTLRGSVLRSRSLAEKRDAVARAWAHLGPALASGAIRPVVDRAFPWTEADQALAWLASDRTVGKVVLTFQE
jgi:putative PIG3 family NAD(P)H quinone oxidoreductase